MNNVVTIDGVSLRGNGAYNISTRTGRFSMPSRRGENLVLPGASGSRFLKNKPFEEGMGALSIWAVGARAVQQLRWTNQFLYPSFETTTSTVTYETNIATNPSAETVGTGGWSTTNAAIWNHTRDATIFHSGTQSVKSVQQAAQSNAAIMSLTLGGIGDANGITATAAQFYSMGCWVYCDTAGYKAAVNFEWMNVGVTTISSTALVYTDLPANTWTFITQVDQTSPALTTTLRAHVTVQRQDNVAGAYTAAAYADDMVVLAKHGITSYFDGDTPNADDFTTQWTGTAHASTTTRTVVNVTGVGTGASTNLAAFSSTQWSSTGTRSLRLYPATQSNATYLDLAAPSGVQMGRSYVVGCKIRVGPAGLSGPVTLRASTTGNTGNDLVASVPLGTRVDAGTAPGVYDLQMRFAYPPNVAAGVTILRLYYGSPYGTSAWVDDFYVIDVTGATATYLGGYFDGSVPNTDSWTYTWTGTANASTTTLTENVVTIASSQNDRQIALLENLQRTQKFFTRGHRLSTIQAMQPDGSMRQAQVEWREWSEPEVGAGATRAEWGIAYTIPSVFWEDVTATTQAAGASAVLPKTLDLTSFTGMTGIIEDAVITVTGGITNPVVTDSETGATISYTGVIAAGQLWIIDVPNATSKVNAVDQLANTRHTGGYKLFTIPNTYNLTDTPRLVLSGTAPSAACNLSVTARRKWVNG